MYRTAMALFCALPVVLASSADASLILNGSFEQGVEVLPNGGMTLPGGSTDIVGWTVTGSSIDLLPTAVWVPSDGDRSLDLSGADAGGIAQTFATVPGYTYTVSFDMAGNPDAGLPMKTMRVSAADVVAEYDFDTAGTSRSDMGWETKIFEFVANDVQTTLEFESLVSGPWGPALDMVSVTSVPGPGALALFAVALAGGGRRRR